MKRKKDKEIENLSEQEARRVLDASYKDLLANLRNDPSIPAEVKSRLASLEADLSKGKKKKK